MNSIQRVRCLQFQFILWQWLFSHHLPFFAPNKSATLLLGAMNNASIPFNTLLNVAVKAALGAPRWLWRIEYWDGIRDTNFHILMVQLPAPRDLKRRSRTSRCRIVRRCPGQIHPRNHRSSHRLAVVPGSQSIQFAIFAGTMVLIDHILDDLRPPLSTHVILIVFLIF